MIVRRILAVGLASSLLTLFGFASESQSAVGIVNFGSCISESKFGKQEQASFDTIKQQMTSLVEDAEKQINEVGAKLRDPEYMDGLSSEAEAELKHKLQALNEEYARAQNQYYQVLNQANTRVIQTMSAQIQKAAEKVAQDKQLSMVVNREACFFFAPGLEVTPLIVAEMDKQFELDMKKQATPAALSGPTEDRTQK